MFRREFMRLFGLGAAAAAAAAVVPGAAEAVIQSEPKGSAKPVLPESSFDGDGASLMTRCVGPYDFGRFGGYVEELEIGRYGPVIHRRLHG